MCGILLTIIAAITFLTLFVLYGSGWLVGWWVGLIMLKLIAVCVTAMGYH
jgi:hypothetical protein